MKTVVFYNCVDYDWRRRKVKDKEQKLMRMMLMSEWRST